MHGIPAGSAAVTGASGGPMTSTGTNASRGGLVVCRTAVADSVVEDSVEACDRPSASRCRIVRFHQ